MTLADLRTWLEDLPAGTLVPAGELVARLDTTAAPRIDLAERPVEPTAAERLWSCPPETRLTVADLSAALHRPASYVYGLTRSGTIPHLKLDGHVVFIASELRTWLAEREERIVQQKCGAPTSGHRN